MASQGKSSNDIGQVQARKTFWVLRKKPTYMVLGVILGVTLPMFSWLFIEMHAAGKALDAFSQRLLTKDDDGAYSTTSPEFQAAISKEEFVDQQTRLCTKLGSLKTDKRGASETTFDSKGGFTTVDTTFVFENAERQFSLKLKKVAGSWRVYGYREE